MAVPTIRLGSRARAMGGGARHLPLHRASRRRSGRVSRDSCSWRLLLQSAAVISILVWGWMLWRAVQSPTLLGLGPHQQQSQQQTNSQQPQSKGSPEKDSAAVISRDEYLAHHPPAPLHEQQQVEQVEPHPTRGARTLEGGSRWERLLGSAAAPPEGMSCPAYLERADRPPYLRDFTQHPVTVSGFGNDVFHISSVGGGSAGGERDGGPKECAVGCVFSNGAVKDYVDGVTESKKRSDLQRKVFEKGEGDGASDQDGAVVAVLKAKVGGSGTKEDDKKKSKHKPRSARAKEAPPNLMETAKGGGAGEGSAAPSRHRPFVIQRSLESKLNYPKLGVKAARQRGVHITCHTAPDSDVPASYASWKETNLARAPPPLEAMSSSTAASAFISNCGAKSLRLEALKALRAAVGVDSFGRCEKNAEESVYQDKARREDSGGGGGGGGVGKAMSKYQLKDYISAHYRFHLAFENSVEPGYATEKFYNALSTGVVPIVIGAPDIAHFAPTNDSFLHVQSVGDVASDLGPRIRQLMQDDEAYEKMREWKKTGGSDAFKAWLDLHIVHSSCRICLHIADAIRREEVGEIQSATAQSLRVDAKTGEFAYVPGEGFDRPCRCVQGRGGGGAGAGGGRQPDEQEGEEMVLYHHAYVRERGMFDYTSVFLTDEQLTLDGLYAAILGAFTAVEYLPLWTKHRDRQGRTRTRQVPSPVADAEEKDEKENEKEKEKEEPDFVDAFSSHILDIYSVYPAQTHTTEVALFGGVALVSDDGVRGHFDGTPCPRLEVIFK